MNKEIIEIIQYHIENKMLITVERKDISTCVILNGFPIAVTDEYLLMTNIVDFHNEGCVLLKCADITDAYSKESDAFYEKICISEGLQREIDKCVLDISGNMISILKQLYKMDSYITIHCEKESEKCHFFMGKIKTISDKSIEFCSLDVDGKWESKKDVIYFSDITMIAFNDHYAKMFYKYIEEK